MSLLIAEGFDDLNGSSFSTHLLNKQYLWSGALIAAHNNSGTGVAGRYGGQAKASGSVGLVNLRWTLPTAISEIYVALAVYRNNVAAGGQQIFSVADSGTDQITLEQQSADPSIIEVYRGATLLGATAAGAFPYQIWRWLSVRIVIHSTNGIIEVRDGLGNVLINLTGQNTQASGAAQATDVVLESTNNASIYWDDVFIMDTAGSTFNGHLTERAIKFLKPNADGGTLDWTASSGDRYTCIDETAADDDSSYIYAADPGDLNLSELEDLAGTETGIAGLILQHRSRKDDIGYRSIRGVIRTGGSNFAGETVPLEATYAHYADLWELNPDTLAAFEPSEINALNVGPEVVS